VRSSEFDLISGKAGGIAALVILRRYHPGLALDGLLEELGDDLIRCAEPGYGGLSWSSPGIPAQHNLTGLSHGAAGIGYALLELFRITGAERYRKAAQAAFDYERYWCDKRNGNWPDFRDISNLAATHRASRATRYVSYWCHGAPGIALSRVRGFQLLKDESLRSDALVGLSTTILTCRQWLETRTGNYSLCHGLAGNAEVVRFTSMAGLDESTVPVRVWDFVARAGIERYGQPEVSWPCGVGGEAPGLMIGLAGIGYFYLSLYSKRVPSVLLLEEDSFCDLLT
jgi:lantibiotic biosynthesis protein